MTPDLVLWLDAAFIAEVFALCFDDSVWDDRAATPKAVRKLEEHLDGLPLDFSLQDLHDIIEGLTYRDLQRANVILGKIKIVLSW